MAIGILISSHVGDRLIFSPLAVQIFHNLHNFKLRNLTLTQFKKKMKVKKRTFFKRDEFFRAEIKAQ
jgi:hypothetical protein